MRNDIKDTNSFFLKKKINKKKIQNLQKNRSKKSQLYLIYYKKEVLKELYLHQEIKIQLIIIYLIQLIKIFQILKSIKAID